MKPLDGVKDSDVCVHCGHTYGDHCGCGAHCLYVAPEERARSEAATTLTDKIMKGACDSCPGFARKEDLH